MNVLLLPGADPTTKELLLNIAMQLGLSKDELTLVDYAFWHSKKPADIKHEVSLLPEGEFDLVIAKSAGAIVFLQGLLTSTIFFKRATLLGAPLSVLDKFEVSEAVFDVARDERIQFISQTNDTVCPAAFLTERSILNVKEIAGSDHMYHETELYLTEIIRHMPTLGR